jgi:hypothetical protein
MAVRGAQGPLLPPLPPTPPPVLPSSGGQPLDPLSLVRLFFHDAAPDPVAMQRGRSQVTKTMAGTFVLLILALMTITPASFVHVTYKLLPFLLTSLWGVAADMSRPGNVRLFGYLACTQLLFYPLVYVAQSGPYRALDMLSVMGTDMVPLFAGLVIDRVASLVFAAAGIVQALLLCAWTLHEGQLPPGTVLDMDAASFSRHQALLQCLRTVLMAVVGSGMHFWVKNVLLELAETASIRRRVISNLVRPATASRTLIHPRAPSAPTDPTPPPLSLCMFVRDTRRTTKSARRWPACWACWSSKWM